MNILDNTKIQEQICEYLDTNYELPKSAWEDVIKWESLDLDNPFYSIREMAIIAKKFDVKVSEYEVAMEYLADNDNSLIESLAIAYKQGYYVTQLNSELLASLLKSKKNLDNFEEGKSKIESFFEDLLEPFTDKAIKITIEQARKFMVSDGIEYGLDDLFETAFDNGEFRLSKSILNMSKKDAKEYIVKHSKYKLKFDNHVLYLKAEEDMTGVLGYHFEIDFTDEIYGLFVK